MSLTFQEQLDAAAGATVCNILGAAGGSLVGAAAISLAAGGPGVGMLTVGALSLLARNYNCNYDPDGESTLPPGGGIAGGQCMETEGCDLLLVRGNGQGVYTGPVRKLISSVAGPDYPNGTPKAITTWIDCDGVLQEDDEPQSQLWPLETRVDDGGVCVGDTSPTPPPAFPTYEWNEGGDAGCSISVKVLGFGLEGDGVAAPVFEMSPGPDSNPEGRAGGGVIGGCNFAPVIYYQPKPPGGGGGQGGDGGEPPIVIPAPDPFNDDDDDWADLLKRALAGAAGALIADAIKKLFETEYPGVDYEMPAPCDVDQEGNPLVWTGVIPEQKFNPAVLDRLDAISNQLSQHLQWKTPICLPEQPELEGDWRKVSFRSDEVSPYGKSRLRKYLRYRSVSGIGLGELVDHWKAFTWTSGATRVRHSGASWGTVEVWAASFDEGKRVIQHAAGEAGIDTAQTGRWSSRVSSSSRLGVSLLMRVDTKGGYYWITEREGSDGKPLVAY